MFFLVKILSHTPINLLYILADILYIIVYKIAGYRKKVVRSNINKAFPELSTDERLIIEGGFFRNFCDFLVETVKAVSLKPRELKKRVKFTNLNELKEILKSNKSILFLASHQFNWEWMQLSAALQFPIPIDYIYHPLHNKPADNLMLKLRGRFGAQPIKRREAARQIIRKIPEGRGFALLADQFPASRDKKAWVSFLNIETGFFYSIDQLARMINQPVLYFHIVKIKRGYYEVQMEVLSMDPKAEREGAIIEKYAKAIQNNIKAQPNNWLWSHKRWKKSRREVEQIK